MRTCAAVLLVVVVAGCQGPRRAQLDPGADAMVLVDTLLPAGEDYARARIGGAEYPIPPYAEFLEGVRICLDPGHGGDAHKAGYKRGPTGVREAEVNLRVAQYLRDCLEAAGAEVLLTREADVDLSLEDRAMVANDWPADLFISLHHNAIGNKPQVNYTTVWYHKTVDQRPASLDLSRYLCEGLLDALAIPQITDVPLKSDQLMYAGGFGVLRHARVTAALVETSFYTNPEEEQRLRDPEYNLREAYGLFLALSKYALSGLPTASLVEPADLAARVGGMLKFELDDGLRGRRAWGHERSMILRDSVAVRIAGQDVPFEFEDDGKRYQLRVDVPDDLTPGEHDVEVQFQNMNKNSVLNPWFLIEVQ